MRFQKCRNYLLLCFFLLENFLYSGVINGWEDFLKLLKDNNIINHQCNEPKSQSLCLVQDSRLFLLYTVCLLSKALSGVFTMQLLKKFSLTYVRMIALFFLVSGGILLAYTTESYQKMVFSGAILISFAGGQLFFCNFRVVNLFPERRCTVIALCCGAFCASRSVFHFFHMIQKDFNVNYDHLFFVWAAMSAIMLLPSLFLMKDVQHPAKRMYAANVAKMFAKTKRSNKKQYQLLENEATSDESDDEKTINNPLETQSMEEMEESFEGWRASNFTSSIPFFLHVWWACTMFLVLMNYDRGFSQSMAQEQDGDGVSLKSRLWQYTPFAMFALSPFIGFLLDCSASKIGEEMDLDSLKKKKSRAGAWALLLITLMNLALVVLKMINGQAIAAMILYTVSYVTSTIVAFAYLTIRFPWEVFCNLLSILWLITYTFIMMQFPLESLDFLYPLMPPIILIILLLTSFVSVAVPFFPSVFTSCASSVSVIATDSRSS